MGLWSLRGSCQATVQERRSKEPSSLTWSRRQRLGFGEAKVARICRAEYQRGRSCSVSSKELQAGIRVLATPLHMCGLKKELPETSRLKNSWSMRRARNSSHCYWPKWRNLRVHSALTLDRVLSSSKTERVKLIYLQGT